MLDLSPLQKSINMLVASIGVMRRYEGPDAESGDPALLETLRSGVIQHFEFTYELCWKFMRRWLMESLGRTEVEGVSRRELFRLAHEAGLITSIDDWMGYHSARNLTSHAYDSKIAAEVYGVSVVFVASAQAFFEALDSKNVRA